MVILYETSIKYYSYIVYMCAHYDPFLVLYDPFLAPYGILSANHRAESCF